MAMNDGTNNQPAWRRGKRAARLLGAPVLLFLLVLAATASGLVAFIDNMLMDARFRLIERAPSDTLVIVEIDPQSIHAEEQWPWPRDRYAKAIANLQDAGAALIALDVDFSSLSDQAGDDAFAQALARRPGAVILPVFWQWSTRDEGPGALLKTPPNEKFLEHAVIASVTLTTEKNGLLRKGWRAVDDAGADRTSLPAMLAGVPADRRETFYIDFGIDPSAIERVSFHKVLDGDFSPEAIRGRNVIIGATALELGDEFAAPILGVVPGVTLHALSYESLVQGRALLRPAPIIPLAFAALVLFWFCRDAAHRRASDMACMHLIVLFVSLVAPLAIQATSPVSFDTGAVISAQVLALFYAACVQLRHRAQQIIRQRAKTMRFQELTGIVVRDNADGVIVTDGAGVIELCNKRAKELLRINREIRPGAKLDQLVADFPALPDSNSRARQTAHRELTIAPGAVLEIIATQSASPTGTRGHETQRLAGLVVYTLRDISVRKRMEAAEQKAKEAALAANALKTQLIANMSHELRTPLNGVIGFASIMKDEIFGAHATPEYKEYALNIHDSGTRLLGLVNNMLNIAKLDAGEFEIAKNPAAIDEIFEKALASSRRDIERRAAAVVADVQQGLPDAMIDASVIHEMLLQLLSNALKFTGDNARVDLRARDEGGALVVEVEDNGCGVDPAMLPKLTRVFYQANSTLNRSHEGAGLGLYLVAKFAALHGASLTLESQAGGGFLARLQFPAAFKSASARNAAPARLAG